MWRAICAVILLPSLTAAQSEVFSTVQSSEARSNLSAQLKPPSYRPHTYYAEIRRGTSEKAAVELVVQQGSVARIPLVIPYGLICVVAPNVCPD